MLISTVSTLVSYRLTCDHWDHQETSATETTVLRGQGSRGLQMKMMTMAPKMEMMAMMTMAPKSKSG
jgi:hypothetical protein